MPPLLLVPALAAGVAACACVVHAVRARRHLLRRLDGPSSATVETPTPRPIRPFARRHILIPWLAATALGVGASAFGISPIFLPALVLLVGLLGGQLDKFLFERKSTRIDEQLADAIDLMIGTLQGGGSLPAALEAALAETRSPLRPCLADVVGRLRLGDAPRAAIADLERRVPREAVRLFCSALLVHGESGGSLTPALSVVGRTLRDRLELGRRVRSLTTHARVSTAAVLLTTYFIALVMWRNDPVRMARFLATTAGQGIAAATVALQVVGVAWTSALSRVRY